jgi:hypothetical protein
MGADISKEQRKQLLLNQYPNCDEIYETLYKKIKEDESNINLLTLLGKIKYMEEKFNEESLNFHIKYIDTGDDYAYIKFMILLESFNNQIQDIIKDLNSKDAL